MEEELASTKVKTLVFVPDGSLRNIPMSVLYDGKQYLLQKYAIALSPRQQLPEAKPLTSKQLKVFMGGISETHQGFSSLPGVAQEVKQIQAEVPAVVLLNQKFTTQAIQQELQSAAFPIVHLATHGNFSSQAENTFILTWNGRLNIKQIEKLLKSRETNGSSPIELIVFSACQTAQGDEQAALGLAGMAVRSGANSTLASLWSVSDEATSILMSNFYSNLAKIKTNKAAALRLAQLDLLKQPQFHHPLFWAPYVLVGNWL